MVDSSTPEARPASDDKQFEGSRVVVTGGTRGLGFEAAKRFTELGADVLVSGRRPPDESLRAIYVETDLAVADGVALLSWHVLETLGGIDVLVDNAGAQTRVEDGVLATSDEDWQRDLDINLFAAIRLDRALVPTMIAQRSGVVIHVSSGAARLPRAMALPYSVSKAALNVYSAGLAKDVARHGVRVNRISPGFMETPAGTAMFQERADRAGVTVETIRREFVDSWNIPLQRPGTPADFADLVTFLASSRASFLTATEFVIDGGQAPAL